MNSTSNDHDYSKKYLVRNIKISGSYPQVQTDFGSGPEAMKKMGAMAVDTSCKGLLKICDALGMENTGKYANIQNHNDGDH
jgi:hypothetical protein